jgi:DNA-directed RNA polymerase subunit RPC12/RpoP
MPPIDEAMKRTRKAQCPKCGQWIPVSKSLFREGFKCTRCQAPLRVSIVYLRVLALMAILASTIVLWLSHIQFIGILFFFLPLGFVFLTVLVRIAPLVVTPSLRGDKLSSVIKLDLS